MTAHFNIRTATAHQPATRDMPTSAAATVTPVRAPAPRRPSRWVTVAGVAAAIGAVGVGALVVDSITEPTPATTVQNVDYGKSQRLIENSIADALRANSGAARSEGPGSNSLGPIVTPKTVSSNQQVQESIDQALLANQPTTLDIIVGDLEANAAITPGSSYQLVQESIDQALAANQPVSSYQLVQESIDQALAANPATTPDGSFEVAEQGRFEALNPSVVVDGSFEVAEQGGFEALNPNVVVDGSFEVAEQGRFEALNPSVVADQR